MKKTNLQIVALVVAVVGSLALLFYFTWRDILLAIVAFAILQGVSAAFQVFVFDPKYTHEDDEPLEVKTRFAL